MICSSRSTRTSLLPWLRRARAIVNSSVLKRTPTPIARFVKLEAPHATRTHAHTHALEAELIIASTVVLPGRAALLLYYYYCDHRTYRSRGRYWRRCHGCRAACIEPLHARVDLTRVCVWPSSAACHMYPPSQPASLSRRLHPYHHSSSSLVSPSSLSFSSDVPVPPSLRASFSATSTSTSTAACTYSCSLDPPAPWTSRSLLRHVPCSSVSPLLIVVVIKPPL